MFLLDAAIPGKAMMALKYFIKYDNDGERSGHTTDDTSSLNAE